MPQAKKGARGKDGTSCPRLSPQKLWSAASAPVLPSTDQFDCEMSPRSRPVLCDLIHRGEGIAETREAGLMRSPAVLCCECQQYGQVRSSGIGDSSVLFPG